jgi:hypothetical protein
MWIAIGIEFLLVVIISVIWVHILNNEKNNYEDD